MLFCCYEALSFEYLFIFIFLLHVDNDIIHFRIWKKNAFLTIIKHRKTVDTVYIMLQIIIAYHNLIHNVYIHLTLLVSLTTVIQCAVPRDQVFPKRICQNIRSF